MRKFYDFLSQCKYRLGTMNNFLNGGPGLEDMGIANFQMLALRGYNDLHRHCFDIVRNFDGDTAYDRLMRERSLTWEDIKKMFVSAKELPSDCSRELLIEAYGKLARGVRELSPKKIVKVYGVKGKNKDHIKNFVVDVDIFNFFNSLFVDGVDEQREVISDLNNDSNATTYFSTVESREKLKHIDEQFVQLTHDYNEKVIDSKKGIGSVYDAVIDYIDTLDQLGVVKGLESRAQFPGVKFSPVRVDFSKIDPASTPVK